MQTPNNLPGLSEAIVRLVTNDVKAFVENLAAAQSRALRAEESRPELADEARTLTDAATDAKALLVQGAPLGELGETIEPIQTLDSWLRSLAYSSAAHWFTIIIENFIGTGHVGQHFEHEGIRYTFHGYRQRPIMLVTGETTVRAAYYRRNDGGNRRAHESGKGIYPLDLILGLDESGTTREAAFLMSHFAAECDYPQAEDLIARATGLRIDQNRLHRQIEALGQVAFQLQQELPDDFEGPPAVARMVIETDGLMVPMRFDPVGDDPEKAKAGWHEAHAGLVAIPGPAEPHEPKYRRKDRSPDRKAKTKADSHQDVKLYEQTYVATYEGRDGHLRKLRVEAERRGWTSATDTCVIGDGADWIHEKTEPLFPGAKHIVDFHHCTERFAKARDMAYELNSAAGAAWYARLETNLWQGNVRAVIRSLTYLASTAPLGRARELSKHAAYFRDRAHMMDYPA